jgi:hypothetical protein
LFYHSNRQGKELEKLTGITGDRLLANAGFSAGAAPAATEAAAAAPEAPAAAETGSKDIVSNIIFLPHNADVCGYQAGWFPRGEQIPCSQRNPKA